MKPRVLASSPVSLPGAGGGRPRLQPVPSRWGEAPASRGRVSAVASGSFTTGEDFGQLPREIPPLHHPGTLSVPGHRRRGGGTHHHPPPRGSAPSPPRGSKSRDKPPLPTRISPRFGASPLGCRGIGRGIWGDARAAAWKEPGGCRLWKLGGSGGWEEDFWGWVGQCVRRLPGAGVEEKMCRGAGEMVWEKRDEGWMGNVEVAESHSQARARQAPAAQPLRWALGNSLLT